MKLKPFIRVRHGKIKGGTTPVDDKPRADMFRPMWMLVTGELCVAFALICGVVLLANHFSSYICYISLVVLLLDGVVAILCWKNQTIRMQSDDTFVHSTLFGKKTEYRFDEIKDIKIRFDSSTTLIVGEGRVLIDSTAIVTERLVNRINKQLESNGKTLFSPLKIIK